MSWGSLCKRDFATGGGTRRLRDRCEPPAPVKALEGLEGEARIREERLLVDHLRARRERGSQAVLATGTVKRFLGHLPQEKKQARSRSQAETARRMRAPTGPRSRRPGLGEAGGLEVGLHWHSQRPRQKIRGGMLRPACRRAVAAGQRRSYASRTPLLACCARAQSCCLSPRGPACPSRHTISDRSMMEVRSTTANYVCGRATYRLSERFWEISKPPSLRSPRQPRVGSGACGVFPSSAVRAELPESSLSKRLFPPRTRPQKISSLGDSFRGSARDARARAGRGRSDPSTCSPHGWAWRRSACSAAGRFPGRDLAGNSARRRRASCDRFALSRRG